MIVVGAGFAGCVVARQAAEAGHQVLVIDKRDHIGGNAHDEIDRYGVLVHPYGPHLFHTNSAYIWEYLSRFTEWRFYEHRSLATVCGELLPFPINLTTIGKVIGKEVDKRDAEEWLATQRRPISHAKTSEDYLFATIGPLLTDLFFRGYTRKHWGLDLSQLSASVVSRVQCRLTDDDRTYTDAYQAIPKDGYNALFKNLLDHGNIRVSLLTPHEVGMCPDHLVYTGPIDAYYQYKYGKLPYRSVWFDMQHSRKDTYVQPTGTVNFPHFDVDYTRRTEFKHITGQVCPGTTVCSEYPREGGEPFYPIPNPYNEALYQTYAARAAKDSHVTFVGRLAQYRYYNMDQVVGAALTAAEKFQ